MDPFARVRVGTTDVHITRFGLGTAPLGGWPTALPPNRARATLRRAWDTGVRYFDTAPLYGHGLSEQYLGTVLSGIPRNTYTLSTKVGRVLEPGVDPDSLFSGAAPFRPVFDFSEAGVRRSLADSRRRLGTDRLDIALIHDPDDHHAEAVTSAFPVLDDLRSKGVIGAIGVGMNAYEPLLRFTSEVDIDCLLLAGRYTLLEQDAFRLLDLAARRRITVIVGGVYNSGVLADPQPGAMYDYAPAPAPILQRAQGLRDICARFDVPLRAAAVQFPYAHPAVGAVVVGARSPHEVDDTVRMLTTEIPQTFWTALKETDLVRPEVPIPAHRKEGDEW